MSGQFDKNEKFEFFNPKQIGQSLEEVGFDIIATETQDVTSRWFHGAKEADLFIWFDQSQNIIKQQMSFLGQVIEWNIVEGVKTGFILDEEIKSETSGNEAIRFDSYLQKTSIQQAIEVLFYVPGLTEDEKKNLENNFISSPTIGQLTLSEFKQKYGQSNQQKKSLKISLWQRCLSLLRSKW